MKPEEYIISILVFLFSLFNSEMEVTSHIPFHIALARMRKLRSEVHGPIESNLAIRAAYFVGNDARLDDLISTVNGYIVE